MMNNPFVVEQARHWAQRVLAEPHTTPADRVQSMYVTALGRTADDQELRDALAFVTAPDPASDERQSWADFAHVLFNLKEFIFIP
jgi:hypothetical protein